MNQPLETSVSTTIKAPAAEVWRALTTPRVIKKWFLGVETESDWHVGSPLVHRGEYQGKPYVDKGEIIRSDPPRVLEHTHWSDVSGKPDRPENYQVVTWELVESSGATTLTVSETNLPSEEGKKTCEAAWKQVLANLKELLESPDQP